MVVDLGGVGGGRMDMIKTHCVKFLKNKSIILSCLHTSDENEGK